MSESVTNAYDGHHFFVRENSRCAATPLFIVLVFVEITDVVFAVDSIPAIFAITQDTFLVYTSNGFAIMGLRSLYFLLADVMGRFHCLKLGLAAVLAFVGLKMLAVDVFEVPIGISLRIIALLLGASILASWMFPKNAAEGAPQITTRSRLKLLRRPPRLIQPISRLGWVLLVLAGTAPGENQTQHAFDSSVAIGPFEPLWHFRVRTKPQDGGLFQVRTGPIFEWNLGERVTLIAGHYFSREQTERGWATTNRPFGGIETAVWNRSLEVDWRSVWSASPWRGSRITSGSAIVSVSALRARDRSVCGRGAVCGRRWRAAHEVLRGLTPKGGRDDDRLRLLFRGPPSPADR